MKNEEVTFALKRIKKAHVVENKQEEHIHSERRILTEADSPFIIKWVQISPLISNFLHFTNYSTTWSPVPPHNQALLSSSVAFKSHININSQYHLTTWSISRSNKPVIIKGVQISVPTNFTLSVLVAPFHMIYNQIRFVQIYTSLAITVTGPYMHLIYHPPDHSDLRNYASVPAPHGHPT